MSDSSRFVDAAACGDLADIKRMLAHPSTPKEVINGTDKDGRSALHYASLNDDVNLLPVLLEDDRVDLEMTTPKQEGIFHMAALYSSLQALNILTTHERVAPILLKLINAQNKFGEAPLHLCAGSGDKNAVKTAKILLDNGARIDIVDNWNRGPLDCSIQNQESAVLVFLKEWLESDQVSDELRKRVKDISLNVAKDQRSVIMENRTDKDQVQLKATFAQMKFGNIKAGLKKATTVEKHIFTTPTGNVADATAAPGAMAMPTGKILSKMIDFPGDHEEISKFSKQQDVNVAGKDSFGLTALHKFASWNKPELIEMILPRLTIDDINAQDLDGKTALHWACEMASVATVTFLVKLPNVDKSIKDKKGRTPMDILSQGEQRNDGNYNVIQRLKAALNGQPEMDI